MKGKPVWLAVAAMLAMMAAGSSLGVEPSLMVTVDENSPQPINVAVGNSFAIELASTPGTGFTWEVQDPLPPGIALAGSGYTGDESSGANSEPRLGAPGRQKFVFKAATQGRGEIVLHYRRPWEKDVPAAKTFKVTVDVK